MAQIWESCSSAVSALIKRPCDTTAIGLALAKNGFARPLASALIKRPLGLALIKLQFTKKMAWLGIDCAG